MSDQKLIDEIISFQLDLRRLEAGTVKRVLSVLDQMQSELVYTLTVKQPMTEFAKARKTQLLKDVTAIIDRFYASAQGELFATADGVAQAQAAHTVVALNDSPVMVNVTAAIPTQAFLERIASNALIEGATISDWWSRLSADTEFKMRGAINQGMAQGETNAEIIRRVIGNNGQSGIIDISKRNAASVVQTAVQTIANDARMKTFEQNADVVPRLEWFSAMDGHVCPLCMARSGKMWTNGKDGSHSPIGHKVPFQNPPIHFNDRCVLLPVTKTFKELGIDLPELPPSTRASSFGQIDSRTTFDEYLQRRTIAQQNEQLGVGRAELWRQGKITTSQLIDGKGRELTLAQLKEKYGKQEIQ